MLYTGCAPITAPLQIHTLNPNSQCDGVQDLDASSMGLKDQSSFPIKGQKDAAWESGRGSLHQTPIQTASRPWFSHQDGKE